MYAPMGIRMKQNRVRLNVQVYVMQKRTFQTSLHFNISPIFIKKHLNEFFQLCIKYGCSKPRFIF